MVFKFPYEKNVYKNIDNNVISGFIKIIADKNTAKMAYKYQYKNVTAYVGTKTSIGFY